jgi:predicted nucleic acid-binding protein
MEGLLARSVRVGVAEISDYELRRELIRAEARAGLARLNSLIAAVEYFPITTGAIRRAAELWAEARRDGIQTADNKALDADMILVAQAEMVVRGSGNAVVVATMDVGDLGRFCDARNWRDVR